MIRSKKVRAAPTSLQQELCSTIDDLVQFVAQRVLAALGVTGALPPTCATTARAPRDIPGAAEETRAVGHHTVGAVREPPGREENESQPVTPENVREEGVNVHLAQLLRNRGMSARAERRSQEGARDVRADLRSGDLVILECKWEESSGLLEGQLDGRLSDFPDALGLLGVLYPGNRNAGQGR